MMNKDQILGTNQIIKGVKPIKNKPYRDSQAPFDKTVPMGSKNFPLTKYTDWQIYGYKWKDNFKIIKEPFWLTKRLPTGKPITPKICGLDGFFDVKAKNQVI